MGGSGSGRWGSGPTVEGSLTLDLGKLFRDRMFRPGESWAGSIVWSNTYTGERAASITYEAYLADNHGRVRFRYTATRQDGERHAADYWVQLITTSQPFGGWRWWFLCPRTGDQVAKLYLPPGAVAFASRRAYRLGYRSQRTTARDRALDRAFKLRRQLGSDGGIDEPIEKPARMHWTTFERKMSKVDRAESIVNGHTWALIAQFEKQLA